MNSTAREPLTLTGEELEILIELLQSERTKLLVEIRHADHRAFRDQLHERLNRIERLIERTA
jgi:hypothetical protein